jgi:hypothetical protein
MFPSREERDRDDRQSSKHQQADKSNSRIHVLSSEHSEHASERVVPKEMSLAVYDVPLERTIQAMCPRQGVEGARLWSNVGGNQRLSWLFGDDDNEVQLTCVDS